MRPEVCRYLKLYPEGGGETLTLWSCYNRPHWERFVLRYDDIVSYHIIGIHLELIMRQGSVMISGWNMPSLTLLLEQRAVRSLREVDQNQMHRLNDPAYEARREDVLTECIFPLAILFSATKSLYAPADKLPVGAILN